MYNPCWAYGNKFYRTLSIRGTKFIACWAYWEPISLHAEHARKCLKVEYLGRIEYDFQKSRLTGPWDHKNSVSAKKVTQKISCLCTFNYQCIGSEGFPNKSNYKELFLSLLYVFANLNNTVCKQCKTISICATWLHQFTPYSQEAFLWVWSIFIQVFANMYKMLKLYIIHSSQLTVAIVALILFLSYELIPRLFLFCFAQYADESPAGYLTRGILHS